MKIIMENPPKEEKKVLEVLEAFDAVFIPRISQRVNLQEYAQKLARNAVWFLAYEKESVSGHCAVYMNERDCAYISSIAVKPEMQGRGIGSHLWNCMENEAGVRGICKIVLKVSKQNAAGIRFYEQHSCRILCEEEGWLMMEKDL